MSMITLTVNGATHRVDLDDPSTPLLYVLRNDIGLEGPRFGCGLGQCGACTVIIKGEAVRSCSRPASSAQGAGITTLEGLAKTASCTRCSRPGSTSRCQPAASARTVS
jgi:aerobic-type carbon monoxide dehydrogenase small subunit (CoxS/CutS family)